VIRKKGLGTKGRKGKEKAYNSTGFDWRRRAPKIVKEVGVGILTGGHIQGGAKGMRSLGLAFFCKRGIERDESKKKRDR